MNNNKLSIGVILVTIGVFFLFVNLGFISFSILFGIFDLWPLILVVVGVNILFKKKSNVPFITWTLFFIILILYGAFYEGRNTIGSTGYNTNFTKYSETAFGELDLDIGASKVSIESEDKNLLGVSLQGVKLDYKETYKNNKQTVEYSFESQKHNMINFNNKSNSYDFYLNKHVIWDLDLDLGAVSGELNLEQVPIKSIDLDFGAGNLDIILGTKHNKSDIKIDSGASNLTIVIPKEAGIKLKLDAALTKTNIDDLKLNKSGDYYFSPNYEEATTKIEFDINMGVGKIDFKIKQ